MSVTQEQLYSRIEQMVEDNTELTIQVSALTESLSEKELELKEMQYLLSEEKEMNIVIRDSVVKFANQSHVSGLIQVCYEYIAHYYKPNAITFYISDDSVAVDIEQMSFSQVYEYHISDGHFGTSEESLTPVFRQMIQSQSSHKELSSLDLAKLHSKSVSNALICKLQYSTRVIGFILLEYYEQFKIRSNNLIYLLLEVFSSSYCNLLITDILAKQYDNALTQAYIDIRTGVGNSRSFESDMQDLYQSGEPYLLLSMDIDNFKRVNDTYGHDVGDEVLKVVAQKIDFHMKRLNGRGYRDGGDEFLGIARGDLETAKEVVQELFLDIATYKFESHDRTDFRITNSGGLYLSDKQERIETVKKKVDILLYRSKENGKKQFTVDQDVTI